MKTTTTITLLTLTTLASTTPLLQHPRQAPSSTPGVSITLFGATSSPADQYTIFIPFDDPTPTNNALGISSIAYDHSASCTFISTDAETQAAFAIEANGALGPPQIINLIYCNPVFVISPDKVKRQYDEFVFVTLRGATDDPADRYTIEVPLDCGAIPTYNGEFCICKKFELKLMGFRIGCFACKL